MNFSFFEIKTYLIILIQSNMYYINSDNSHQPYIFPQMLTKTAQKLSNQLYHLYQPLRPFSTKITPINLPPIQYIQNREELKANIWRDLDKTGKKSQQTHLSNSEQLIKRIPVLKVKSDVVRCMGGVHPFTAHPQVYIQVNTRTPGQPVACKYCGVRYALDVGHHH